MQAVPFFDEITRLRRELHQIPEIAGKEFKTCALIRETLSTIEGIEVLPPFLETDTVVLIRGEKGPGPHVLLRADIDALPGNEETNCDYPSQHPGMMHACGHDMHAAILVGVIRNLAARRSEFAGVVRCVFQPGEENVAMARDLIEAGAMGEELPDVCAALHVMPGAPVGDVSVKEGAMMAASNHFKVTVHGQGGHGSLPSASRSPLIAAASMVMELQNVIPSRVDPRRSGVLSICHFESGFIDNVIPEKAVFSGTMRSLDNETAQIMDEALHEICHAAAVIHRVRCEVESHQCYLATCNTTQAVKTLCKVVNELEIPLHMLEDSAMSSEDFSFYLAKSPGVFFRLGAGVDAPSLHNPKYFPPNEVMVNGINIMSAFALESLKK